MTASSDVDQTFKQLEKRLSSVSGIARLISFLHGLGDVLIVCFAFFLFSFLTDFLITDLPAIVRQIISGAGFLIIAYTVWSAVIQPQLHPLSTRDVAAELEGIYPELNDRLISALDLKEEFDESQGISQGMVDSLIEDLDRSINRINPFLIFTFNPLIRRFGTGLLCLGLFVLFFWTFPQEGKTWIVRLTGQNAKWPQATRITLQTTRDIQVVEGNNFSVKASVDPGSKRIPDTARIQILRENGPSKNIEMSRGTPGSQNPVFVHKFQNVQDDFRYTVRAGDGETGEGTVHVLDRPRIKELLIQYDYPDYTGKDNTPPDSPVSSRELSAPFDTIATVRASIPSTVQKVKAYFDSGQEMIDLPVSLSSSPDRETRKTVQTELQMQKDGDLFFELFMKNKEQSTEETPCSIPFAVCSSRFSVKTKVDQPPQVKLIYPGKNKFATPRASLPIRSEATDDYGIASIKFTRRINDGDSKTISFDSNQNDQPYEQSTIKSEYQFDLSSLEISSGDNVYYAISATDVGNTNEKPSRTKRYRISIITPARFEVKLQNLQEKIRERLVNLRDDQKQETSRLENNLEQSETESSETLSSDLQQELEKRLNKQRSLNQRMKRINNELLRMNRDARFNNLWDKKSRNTLEKIYEDAKQIKSDRMEQASKQIAKVSTVTDPDRRTDLLNRALTMQEQTVRRLDNLLQEMGAWYNYADIIHEWKKVLENLEKLRNNEDSLSPG